MNQRDPRVSVSPRVEEIIGLKVYKMTVVKYEKFGPPAYST
jgi:hypothetical protein